VWLALQLRHQLEPYQRFSAPAALFHVGWLLLRRAARRWRGVKRSKQLASGGAVIAFVGPEATGKSTLVRETSAWLGRVFEVRSAHLGKPPSTWLTFLPNLAARLLRALAPRYRPSQAEANLAAGGRRSPSLLYGLSAVLVAWDRRALARRLHRLAANGALVICDRYPSRTVGAMDSARLGQSVEGRLLQGLARWEDQFYRQIPAPDVVIQLSVPLEVAVQRNLARPKKEAVAYVARRHALSLAPEFPAARAFGLDSNQPQGQTIARARQLVWEAL
jgi:thymidylate kinase